MKVELTNQQINYLASLMDAEVKRVGLNAAVHVGPIAQAMTDAANAEQQKEPDDGAADV